MDGVIMFAETVTGFVGQILDEGVFDEYTRDLLDRLYDLALKEVVPTNENLGIAQDGRHFVIIANIDENAALKDSEINGATYNSPGDYLEQNFALLNQRGIGLEDWVLLDDDIKWENYLLSLGEWIVEHGNDDYIGETPPLYEER